MIIPNVSFMHIEKQLTLRVLLFTMQSSHNDLITSEALIEATCDHKILIDLPSTY